MHPSPHPSITCPAPIPAPIPYRSLHPSRIHPASIPRPSHTHPCSHPAPIHHPSPHPSRTYPYTHPTSIPHPLCTHPAPTPLPSLHSACRPSGPALLPALLLSLRALWSCSPTTVRCAALLGERAAVRGGFGGEGRVHLSPRPAVPPSVCVPSRAGRSVQAVPYPGLRAQLCCAAISRCGRGAQRGASPCFGPAAGRSEEHTSELQSR